MSNNPFINKVKQIYKYLYVLFGLLIVGSVALIYIYNNPSFSSFFKEEPKENYVETTNLGEVKNGIHLATGFKNDEGLQLVITNCTTCHSAKLVTQNRATKEGWISIIRWMQETQNLWDLGKNEATIVNYLAKHYAPEQKARREALKDIEWYDLED